MHRLLLLFCFLASASLAEVPEEIKKQAGYQSAVNILKMCTSATDTLLCLSEIGSECTPIASDGKESYRCRLTVTLDATRVSSEPQKAEIIGDYLIVSRITNTPEGWSAEIEEVTKS